ncbi:MAG: ExbD/TolR family protein [Massilia sp.]|jgi:biopolymer transport protein ExbD
MDDRLRVRVADNETIYIDGRTLVGKAELVDAFRSALRQNPNVTLVIEPVKAEYYAGVAKVIYASQRAGIRVENLHYATGNA